MLKTYKPTTPGRRKRVILVQRNKGRKKPYKKLTKGIKRSFGRGRGKISVRHRGGGHKRLYRKIDFGQEIDAGKAKVISIEYDPNRSADIALIEYHGGEKRYILAYEGIKIGHEIECGEKVAKRSGNRTRLKNLGLGTEIYNIETRPGGKGTLCRSAGCAASVLSKEGKYVTLRMPSKERRLILSDSFATIGRVSPLEHSAQRLGSAGDSRHKGIRPTVRGVAMHPGAHPHGGGEGRSGIGMSTPKTVYGKPAKGVKTRKRKKYSNKLIIKKR